MSRRRRREPDQRPDWRDPDMPVVRNVVYGQGILTISKIEEVDPKEVEDQAKGNMAFTSNPLTPHWSRDPTYDLAIPKSRRWRRSR